MFFLKLTPVFLFSLYEALHCHSIPILFNKDLLNPFYMLDTVLRTGYGAINIKWIWTLVTSVIFFQSFHLIHLFLNILIMSQNTRVWGWKYGLWSDRLEYETQAHHYSQDEFMDVHVWLSLCFPICKTEVTLISSPQSMWELYEIIFI